MLKQAEPALVSGAFRGLFVIVVALIGIATLIASGGSPNVPPKAPILLAPTKNANLPTRLPNEEISTVFFSRSEPLQETDIRRANFAYNSYPDLFVSSQYAFQVALDPNELLNSEFAVYDEAGAPVQRAAVERVNPDLNKLPGSPGWIPRPTYSDSTAVYSTTVSVTCNGVPRYGRSYDCPQSSTQSLALVLTIKPITARIIHGTGYSYTLEWKNSLGSARRKIKVVYVEPDRCKISSFLAGADAALAYESRVVNWSTQDCHSVRISWVEIGAIAPYTPTVLQVLDDKTVMPPDTASETRMGQTLSVVIEPKYTSTLQIWASDAMGQNAQVRKTFQVAPCSISSTDPRCESRCQQIPRPSNCPTPASELPKVCGASTPSGLPVSWSFQILCNTGGGTAIVLGTESETKCTEEEARQAIALRQTPNCAPVRLTGPGLPPLGETPSPMCMQPGQSSKEYKFCLRCGTSPTPATFSGTGCNAFEAEQDAKNKAAPNLFCSKEGLDGPCP